MSLPKAILFFLLGGFISQIIYYYPNLPGRIASHFNAFGEADGWTSKQNFLFFQLALFLLAAFFSFALPSLIKRMPPAAINLPNKEYWLAPERAAATYDRLSRWFEWLGIGLSVLLISINQLVIRANLSNQELSVRSWYILGAFLLFVGIQVFRLCRNFKITE